jgi:hypothetical protein
LKPCDFRAADLGRRSTAQPSSSPRLATPTQMQENRRIYTSSAAGSRVPQPQGPAGLFRGRDNRSRPAPPRGRRRVDLTNGASRRLGSRPATQRYLGAELDLADAACDHSTAIVSRTSAGVGQYSVT